MPPLVWLFRQILRHQEKELGTITLSHQNYWHSSFGGRVVELACRHCQRRLSTDFAPRWAVHRPGTYMTPNRKCYSATCKGKTISTVPVDKNINFTSSSTMLLFQSPQEPREPRSLKYERYLLQKGVEDVSCPPTVECWCIRCREKTLTASGTNTFTDTDPSWTIGDRLYLEKVRSCKRCQADIGQRSQRFIPIENIPSLRYNFFIQSHRRYASLDRSQCAALLTVGVARFVNGLRSTNEQTSNHDNWDVRLLTSQPSIPA